MKLDAYYTQGGGESHSQYRTFMPWMELLNFMHRGSAAVLRHFPASHPENRRAFFGHGLILETCKHSVIPKYPKSVSDRYSSFLVVFVHRLYHAYTLLHAGLPKSKSKANSSSNASVSMDIMVASGRSQECMFVLAIHHYVSSPCIKGFIIIITIIIIIIIILHPSSFILHLSSSSSSSSSIIYHHLYSKFTAEVLFCASSWVS